MSGDRYIIHDQNAIYFLTFTTIGWMDIFSRMEYRIILADSLNYCIQQKGLTVFAWVVMSNHIHLIVRARTGFKLSDIIRDYKKFTAKRIIAEMENIPESRREWMKNKMRFEGRKYQRVKEFKFWKDGYHGVQLETNKMIDQRLYYLHNNPVKALIVDEPEHYIFSSARDYCGEKGLVNIELLI